MVALPRCEEALALCDRPQRLCSTCMNKGMVFDVMIAQLQLVLLKPPTSCCHPLATVLCMLAHTPWHICLDVVQIVSSMHKVM